MGENPFSFCLLLFYRTLTDFVCWVGQSKYWKLEPSRMTYVSYQIVVRPPLVGFVLVVFSRRRDVWSVVSAASMNITPWDQPERDKVISVRESHHALAVLFWYWKEVFQHISQPDSEARRKIIEYQVGVLFRNGRVLVGFYVVSELDVVEGEVNGWTVGEMRDDHRVCRRKKRYFCVWSVGMGDNHLVCLDVRGELSDP